MYYYEVLDDGTVIGLYDGARKEGEVAERFYWAYHEEIAKREHPATRGHMLGPSTGEWPLRAIDNARVRTALISTYRVHSREYFWGGTEFSRTWHPRPEKVNASERFSPSGAVGYYFALTIDGALDEACYYARSKAELERNASKIILVHRAYYSDLLYLAPVLPAVWAHLNLPEVPTWEMYLAVMDPTTSNKITDAIGTWARGYGFRGIIYPSARYGQLTGTIDQNEGELFPVLNFVEIGSHLCEQGIAIQLTLNALVRGLARRAPARPLMPVYSEPNLVIFDERTIDGSHQPVFYATYSLGEADMLRQQDERAGLKHQIEYGCDEEGRDLCE